MVRTKPRHMYPASSVHVAEHPSPSAVLPSSHVSPACSTRSPHVSGRVLACARRDPSVAICSAGRAPRRGRGVVQRPVGRRHLHRVRKAPRVDLGHHGIGLPGLVHGRGGGEAQHVHVAGGEGTGRELAGRRGAGQGTEPTLALVSPAAPTPVKLTSTCGVVTAGAARIRGYEQNIRLQAIVMTCGAGKKVRGFICCSVALVGRVLIVVEKVRDAGEETSSCGMRSGA